MKPLVRSLALAAAWLFVWFGVALSESRPIVLYATHVTPALEASALDYRTNGVNLVVKDAGTQKCALAKKHAPKRAYVICERSMDYAGLTVYGKQTVVYIDPASASRTGTYCHELMHATTHIADGGLPDQGASCVWGELDHLGPFDIAWLHEHRIMS